MTAQTQHTWLITAVRRKHHVLAMAVTPRIAFGDYQIHKPAPAGSGLPERLGIRLMDSKRSLRQTIINEWCSPVPSDPGFSLQYVDFDARLSKIISREPTNPEWTLLEPGHPANINPVFQTGSQLIEESSRDLADHSPPCGRK